MEDMNSVILTVAYPVIAANGIALVISIFRLVRKLKYTARSAN